MANHDRTERPPRAACEHQQLSHRAKPHRRSGKIARPFCAGSIAAKRHKRHITIMHFGEIKRRLFLCFWCLFAANALIVAQTGPKSLPAVTSQAEFDKISVTYDA